MQAMLCFCRCASQTSGILPTVGAAYLQVPRSVCADLVQEAVDKLKAGVSDPAPQVPTPKANDDVI